MVCNFLFPYRLLAFCLYIVASENVSRFMNLRVLFCRMFWSFAAGACALATNTLCMRYTLKIREADPLQYTCTSVADRACSVWSFEHRHLRPAQMKFPEGENVHVGYMVPWLVWDHVPSVYISHIGNVTWELAVTSIVGSSVFSGLFGKITIWPPRFLLSWLFGNTDYFKQSGKN